MAVSEAAGLSRSDGGSQGGLKVADLVERELDFHRNIGPIEWNKDFTNWSWAKPEGADINPTTQSYVRTSIRGTQGPFRGFHKSLCIGSKFSSFVLMGLLIILCGGIWLNQ